MGSCRPGSQRGNATGPIRILPLLQPPRRGSRSLPPRGAGQRTVDPDRTVALQQVPAPVGGGEVIMAGDSHQRPADRDHRMFVWSLSHYVLLIISKLNVMQSGWFHPCANEV